MRVMRMRLPVTGKLRRAYFPRSLVKFEARCTSYFSTVMSGMLAGTSRGAMDRPWGRYLEDGQQEGAHTLSKGFTDHSFLWDALFG